MTKVRLAGNHSATHSGCAAVWDVLRNAMALQNAKLVDADDFDVLVMNGEGSMHHGRPAFEAKMRTLGEALSRGRRAFLVNTVWEENPGTFDGVLRKLSGVIVREAKSKADLEQRHGISARVSIDLSYFAQVEPAGPHNDFKNQIVISDFFSPEFGNFVRPTAGPLVKYSYLNLSDGPWPDIVRSLRTSRLFVTGRHHGVYAACKARVPFIALRGNSHKVTGLFQTAGVNIPVCNSIPEVVDQINNWKGDLTEFHRLWRWLDEQKIEHALPNLAQVAK